MMNKKFIEGFEKVAFLQKLRAKAMAPSTKIKGAVGMGVVGAGGAAYGGYKLMDKITDAPQGPQQDW